MLDKSFVDSLVKRIGEIMKREGVVTIKTEIRRGTEQHVFGGKVSAINLPPVAIHNLEEKTAGIIQISWEEFLLLVDGSLLKAQMEYCGGVEYHFGKLLDILVEQVDEMNSRELRNLQADSGFSKKIAGNRIAIQMTILAERKKRDASRPESDCAGGDPTITASHGRYAYDVPVVTG